MVAFRLGSLLTAALLLVGCTALTAQLNDEMAPQISTEVAVQVGTAIAGKSASEPQPEAPPIVVAESPYDCEQKYCSEMISCEEAVYKLTVCDQDVRDSDGDGIPCESICSRARVDEILARQSFVPLVEQPREIAEEIGPVTRVVDGDTIDVRIDGVNTRIRYLQMNTPERDEDCYQSATDANAALVENKTVRLVPDTELVDRYDRLLRYIYVGDVLVNRVLVEQGFAEVALYPPNDAHYEEFVRLEAEAAAEGRGCHPTGIFDDRSTTR